MTILINKLGSKIATPPVPKGSRMLFDQITGCPSGWTKVTGVTGYHFRGASSSATVGVTNAADVLTHHHHVIDSGGAGDLHTAFPGTTDDITPTLTYPAIKYLLCEKQ